MKFVDIVLILTSLAFFFYGINCLFSKKMIDEFNRFGLSGHRILTGILQIVGATGLIAGYCMSSIELIIISSLGLSVLMFLGFVVRLKIKDSFFQSLPAFTFALINLYISIVHLYYV